MLIQQATWVFMISRYKGLLSRLFFLNVCDVPAIT